MAFGHLEGSLGPLDPTPLDLQLRRYPSTELSEKVLRSVHSQMDLRT